MLRARFAWLLCFSYLGTARMESAVLIAEPRDFDQVLDSELCWLVLFTSLHEGLVEEEAKRRFLLLPHYNDTFVRFATTTVEEVPDMVLEFDVDRTKPDVLLFHRHGRNATKVEAGNWYLMEDSWGTHTERTKMRMASRERGADALGSTVKTMLVEAGNPSTLSGRSKPSTITHRHLEIPEHKRFQIYSKLADPRDEL